MARPRLAVRRIAEAGNAAFLLLARKSQLATVDRMDSDKAVDPLDDFMAAGFVVLAHPRLP